MTGELYVLIVDDEQETLRLLSRYLETICIPALTALDAQSALAVLEDKSVDIGVILLDLALPGMDGYDLFKTIRDDPTTARIPVVAVTALGPDSHARSLEAGMDGYLAKPFTLRQLKDMLATLGMVASNGS